MSSSRMIYLLECTKDIDKKLYDHIYIPLRPFSNMPLNAYAFETSLDTSSPRSSDFSGDLVETNIEMNMNDKIKAFIRNTSTNRYRQARISDLIDTPDKLLFNVGVSMKQNKPKALPEYKVFKLSLDEEIPTYRKAIVQDTELINIVGVEKVNKGIYKPVYNVRFGDTTVKRAVGNFKPRASSKK